MGKLVSWMDKKLFTDYQRNWDDHIFREEIMGHIKPEYTVLDIGAGAGIVPQMNFKGMARKICGIDPDPRVVDNPYLDEGKIGLGEEIPYPDNSFDLVFADNVLEHLADPVTVMKEISRVLKPGGYFLGKTPNRWHYMPLIARMTPTGFHKYINKKRGRDEEDTFPTRYLMNCPTQVRDVGDRSGFRVESIKLIEGRPEYLRFNAVTYLLGYLYERLVNSIPPFKRFRILMVVSLQKQDGSFQERSIMI